MILLYNPVGFSKNVSQKWVLVRRLKESIKKIDQKKTQYNIDKETA